MGIFDNFLNKVNQVVPAGNESQTFTFSALPESADELRALPEAALDTPFKAAALTVCALCAYAAAPEIGKEMLNFLKGPVPLSPYEMSFIKDRLRDSKLVPFSYFKGAVPGNNYTPDKPFTVTVSSNPYSYPDDTHATLYIRSGGADNPRQVKLRKKPSEGKWYMEEQMLLVSIRAAKSEDPWA